MALHWWCHRGLRARLLLFTWLCLSGLCSLRPPASVGFRLFAVLLPFWLGALISCRDDEILRFVSALVCLVCSSLRNDRGGVMVAFFFVLDSSLGIPEGKNNPCSFFRSPSPPGEVSGR